jgi:hypothetical protein
MSERERYNQLSTKTAQDLRTIARSLSIQELSSLTLPEIDKIVDLVAQMVPAGNVPGVILNGLARLKGRHVSAQRIRSDIDMLFSGVKQMLDKAVYGAFFAGPAAVIWAYQNLLKLAGKSPEDAFPGGVWQFYADYALREDTARHANETHGFDTVLSRHGMHLSPVDRVTAWAMTAITVLHSYDALLENEWRERVSTHLLDEVTSGEVNDTYRAWRRVLPYRRTTDATEIPYPTYRRRTFDAFLETATEAILPQVRRRWKRRLQDAEENDLPAYQRQMSIVAYLDPGLYGETHVPIPLRDAYVGVIHHEHYYLIAACAPDTDQPASVKTVRRQIAAILADRVEQSPPWPPWAARVKRIEWTKLHDELSPEAVQDLDALKLTPILLNSDRRSHALPLAELRQTARGVGNHALTLFDTGETFVFDQSHVFFDGGWGAALVEIMTNEALSWAVYLDTLPPPVPADTLPYRLKTGFQGADLDRLQQARVVPAEISAETSAVNLKAMLGLRRLFKQRSDLLALTVNDLLILYRAIHAMRYAPSGDLLADLQTLASRGNEKERHAARLTLAAIASSRQDNPPILIPVDASHRAPRDRIYPMTFEVPLDDLELLDLHDRTVGALRAYNQAAGDRSALYAEFDHLQRTYLGTLAGLGRVLSRAKQIAHQGETAAVGTLKMLAHLPPSLQSMLDQVPGRFDVLNDLIKGREVFSNVGAVAPHSTLTRFITAKDDNEKKSLAWGVLTDADGVMQITLRDFRPHVVPMIASGHLELARRVTGDYVRAFARGLNGYVQELLEITRTSRETRVAAGEIENE